jgi:hypothetical protein
MAMLAPISPLLWAALTHEAQHTRTSWLQSHELRGWVGVAGSESCKLAGIPEGVLYEILVISLERNWKTMHLPEASEWACSVVLIWPVLSEGSCPPLSGSSWIQHPKSDLHAVVFPFLLSPLLLQDVNLVRTSRASIYAHALCCSSIYAHVAILEGCRRLCTSLVDIPEIHPFCTAECLCGDVGGLSLTSCLRKSPLYHCTQVSITVPRHCST